MKKKDLVFTIGLCIFMGVLWVVGEIVMGLWIALNVKAHIMWLVSIVVVTLAVSVWHSLIEDNSDYHDPKREKYRKKVKRYRRK